MVQLQQIKPLEIEAESFRIIERAFESQTGRKVEAFTDNRFPILRRVIHATGDFSFCESLSFSEGAVEAGIESIRQGKNILLDVNMGAAGISKGILGRYGGRVICRVSDPVVAEKAKVAGLTRSETAMSMAVEDNIGIIGIGNAPTALLACMELIDKGVLNPDLVVGVPVGFVNAAESKEILSQKGYPFITSLGRKGGSPVAAAIINAILRLV